MHGHAMQVPSDPPTVHHCVLLVARINNMGMRDQPRNKGMHTGGWPKKARGAAQRVRTYREKVPPWEGDVYDEAADPSFEERAAQNAEEVAAVLIAARRDAVARSRGTACTVPVGKGTRSPSSICKAKNLNPRFFYFSFSPFPPQLHPRKCPRRTPPPPAARRPAAAPRRGRPRLTVGDGCCAQTGSAGSSEKKFCMARGAWGGHPIGPPIGQPIAWGPPQGTADRAADRGH